ncbi:MAG: AEC family transporter [Planctomycetota bacterium]
MGGVREILDTVLPVFLVIGVGYGLRRGRFFGPEAEALLSRFVFYVPTPALLFRSVATVPLRETVRPVALGAIVAVTVLLAFAVYAGAARLSPARRGVVAQGAHRSNMVFVGLPVIINAHGAEAVAPAAVLIGCMVVVYNLLGVVVLVLPHHRQGDGFGALRRRTLLEFLRNPLILASGVGLLFSGWGLALPVAVDRSLDLVGEIAMPLALIAVGVGLDFGRLRAELLVAALVGALKLVVYPALVFAALYATGSRDTYLAMAVLVLASPTAVVSYVMAQEMKGDAALAASIVIGTTLASLVTLAGWLAVLRLVL